MIRFICCATLIFPSFLFSQTLTHSPLECFGNPNNINLTNKIIFKIAENSAIINWKDQLWLLDYKKTTINRDGDYLHEYDGYIFNLKITKNTVDVFDKESNRRIFSDILIKCSEVTYIK
jgi:hypothetical protein